MKKRYLGIIIAGVLVIGGTASGFAYEKYSNRINQNQSSFDQINQKSNLKDLVNDARLVVKGKVMNSEETEVQHLTFTNYNIEVHDVVKGDDKNVVVSLTGSESRGMPKEIKPLVAGQEYIFCLKKVYPEDVNSNLYTAIGEYQGIFAIEEPIKSSSTTSGAVNIEDKENEFKIKSFNESNAVEKSIVGKKLSIEDFK